MKHFFYNIMPHFSDNAARIFSNLFRAFKNRNYRLFFFGHGVSLIGTWMQQVALSWYVYRITGSPFLLGFTGFMNHIPSFFLAPVSGVLADRFDRHKLLLLTQSCSMIQAFSLTYAVHNFNGEVWRVILLTFTLGVINSFDAPIRQAFVLDMLDRKEDLSNAIALNSAIFNSARLIGPAIAGITVHMFGETPCFLFNAMSYAAVITSLLLMKIKPREILNKNPDIIANIKEGFRYAAGFPPIRMIIQLVGLTSFMTISYNVLMPVFARDVLKGSADTLGYLMGAVGCGALAGISYIASRKSVAGLERVAARNVAILGASLMLFSQSRSFAFSLVFMFTTGVGMISCMASCNTMLQTLSDDDKRGRVMSIYTMALIGMAPFGSLISGFCSKHIGAPATLFFCGFFCLAAARSFSSKLPVFREFAAPVYAKKGIN